MCPTKREVEPLYLHGGVAHELVCVHCHRRCGNMAGGFARLAGRPLCSRPVEAGRPDCYRMVMTKFHHFYDCEECMDRTPYSYPRQPRRLPRLP